MSMLAQQQRVLTQDLCSLDKRTCIMLTTLYITWVVVQLYELRGGVGSCRIDLIVSMLLAMLLSSMSAKTCDTHYSCLCPQCLWALLLLV